MKNIKLIIIALAGLMLPGLAAHGAGNDALLNLLVKKGVITRQEADGVKNELAMEEEAEAKAAARETAQAAPKPAVAPAPAKETAPAAPAKEGPAAKVVPGKLVDKLTLSGDLRFRYQYDNAMPQAIDDNKDRSRYRYRLRLASEYAFSQNWRAGARLETSNAGDSTNSTFGGFFDKNGDGVYVGLVYVQYADESFDVRIGKHKQPFLMQPLLWDTDINPEGFSEQYTFEDFTIRAGQYVIDDQNETKGDGIHDSFLFAGQIEYRFDALTFAPTVMTTTGGQSYTYKDKNGNDVSASETGATPANENASPWYHNFLVVQMPVEYKFEFFGLKNKVFGAYGWNLQGKDLAQDPGYAYSYKDVLGKTVTDHGAHNQFFNLGLQIGAAKKAGQWQAGLEYRFIEAAAYTPNLSDSDWAKNALNQQGWLLGLKYCVTDYLFTTVNLMKSENIDPDFNSTHSSLGSFSALQLELTAEF